MVQPGDPRLAPRRARRADHVRPCGRGGGDAPEGRRYEAQSGRTGERLSRDLASRFARPRSSPRACPVRSTLTRRTTSGASVRPSSEASATDSGPDDSPGRRGAPAAWASSCSCSPSSGSASASRSSIPAAPAPWRRARRGEPAPCALVTRGGPGHGERLSTPKGAMPSRIAPERCPRRSPGTDVNEARGAPDVRPQAARIGPNPPQSDQGRAEEPIDQVG